MGLGEKRMQRNGDKARCATAGVCLFHRMCNRKRPLLPQVVAEDAGEIGQEQLGLDDNWDNKSDLFGF